jgi:general secretion pathway protein M
MAFSTGKPGSGDGAFARARASMQQSWEARNARERGILAFCALLVLLALFYLLLIAPAQEARANLEKTVPALRQQVALMQGLAREAQALNLAGASAAGGANPATGAGAPIVEPQSQESLEAALGARGLKAQSIVVSGETARVQMSAVSFTGLLEWLAAMQAGAAMSMADASITALEQIDMVNATVTLRQPKAPGQ